MTNTILPYDNKLEDSVLGAIISNNDVYDDVVKYFNDIDVFGQNKAKALWNKIMFLKREK